MSKLLNEEIAEGVTSALAVVLGMLVKKRGVVEAIAEAFERGRQRARRPEGLVGRVAIAAHTDTRLGVIRHVSPGGPESHDLLCIEDGKGELIWWSLNHPIRLAPLDEEAGDG